MSIHLRALQRSDYPDVIEIVRDIWDGDDYVPLVFIDWIQEKGSYCRGLFVNEKLVGFSRLKRLSNTIGWLQGLRVDPSEQGKGYGRMIAEKMVDFCFSVGLKDLYFSTYFDNKSSIHIHERIGFERIGTYTNLYKPVDKPPRHSPQGCITLDESLPIVREGFWNGWSFYPQGTESWWRFLPEYLTLIENSSGNRIVVARNCEFDRSLEISFVECNSGRLSDDIILHTEKLCYNRGHSEIHLMLPSDAEIAPFIENGYSFFERENDVFLYRLSAD